MTPEALSSPPGWLPLATLLCRNPCGRYRLQARQLWVAAGMEPV